MLRREADDWHIPMIVPKSYAAGLEMNRPGGACIRRAGR
jgi:hypothetical protein